MLFKVNLQHHLSKKAFSLIELIVVIAIIAVVSAAGFMSFSSLTGDRLTADARKIINDLCWIRQLAVAGSQYIPMGSRQNYIVVFDTASESYTIYEGSVNPSNQIKTQSLNPGVDLASISPLPAQITFSYPLGTAETKTITLNSQGRTRQVITFANTGYVRIDPI